MTAGVVVPLRSFRTAAERLAPVLDPDARAELARRMADTVIAAAGELPLVVVSSAPEVREWAADHGLRLLDDPGSLDDAAHVGLSWVRAQGLDRVIVVHADLPRARTLAPVLRDADRPIVALVPCHRDDGTPVLSLPAAAEFTFSYGPGSFRRHVTEAKRLGLGIRVVRDPALAADVDLPDDLDLIA